MPALCIPQTDNHRLPTQSKEGLKNWKRKHFRLLLDHKIKSRSLESKKWIFERPETINLHLKSKLPLIECLLRLRSKHQSSVFFFKLRLSAIKHWLCVIKKAHHRSAYKFVEWFIKAKQRHCTTSVASYRQVNEVNFFSWGKFSFLINHQCHQKQTSRDCSKNRPLSLDVMKSTAPKCCSGLVLNNSSLARNRETL